jgi:hypothetical protein
MFFGMDQNEDWGREERLLAARLGYDGRQWQSQRDILPLF